MSGPQKKFTVNVNFLLEEDLRDQIDAYAERNGVRRSDVMRKMVKDWCERVHEPMQTAA